MAFGGSRGVSWRPLDPSGSSLGAIRGRCEPVQVYLALSWPIWEPLDALRAPDLYNFHDFWLQFAFTVPFLIDVVLICDAFCDRFQVDEIRAADAKSRTSNLWTVR